MSITADRKERLASLAGVGLLHLLMGWALLLSLAPGLVRGVSETMAVFNVRQAPMPPPPQREVIPTKAPAPAQPVREAAPAAAKPEGAVAAPASAAPSPATARDTPPPVLAGIVPASGGESAPLTGGPNWMTTGGGGSGAGSGSGTSGSGSGGGGTGGSGSGGAEPVARAKLRGGKIVPGDYPRAARGAQGTVEARLTVSAAGAVTGCRVTRSSGNPVLDETTCRLIRERFRFAPARDAQGRAVADVQGWQQRWWRD